MLTVGALERPEFMNDWAYGTVPDWIAAVTAVMGLLFAVVAARAAWGTLQVERERDQSAAAERRSAQAAQVAAWCESLFLSDEDLTIQLVRDLGLAARKIPEGELIIQSTLVVRNASELPIYDVKAEVSEALNAGSSLIAPGKRTEFPLGTKRYPAVKVTPPVVAELRFRDAAGARWRRSKQGHLCEEGGSGATAAAHLAR